MCKIIAKERKKKHFFSLVIVITWEVDGAGHVDGLNEIIDNVSPDHSRPEKKIPNTMDQYNVACVCVCRNENQDNFK
jgi:hypothetical protein